MTKPIFPGKTHKCRKCGGRAPFNEEEGVYKCIACDHEELELRAYYQFCEEHKKEIIQDVLDIGSVKTRAKWQMPIIAWRLLCKRWGIHRVWAAPGFHARSEDGHRKLPAFRHDWPPELKMKWLEVYQSLVAIKEK